MCVRENSAQTPCQHLLVHVFLCFPLHQIFHDILHFARLLTLEPSAPPPYRLPSLTFSPSGQNRKPRRRRGDVRRGVGAPRRGVGAPRPVCSVLECVNVPLDRIVHVFCLLVSGAALHFPALAPFKAGSCAVRTCLSLLLLCFLSVRAGPAQHRARVSTDY